MRKGITIVALWALLAFVAGPAAGVIIVGPGSPPVAVDDSASTEKNVAVTIDVLWNDSDPDGDALSVESVGLSEQGVLPTVNEDGSVAYTPPADFVGVDTFEYTVSDGRGGTDVGLVTVTVEGPLPANEPPTVDAGGPYVVDEGSSVAMTAVAADPENQLVGVAWTPYVAQTGYLTEVKGQVVFVGVDGPSVHVIEAVAVDALGLAASDQATVTVSNVPPTVGDIQVPVDPVAVNKPVLVSAPFTDPGILDTHIAVWEWGDGTSSPGAVAEVGGSGLASGSHVYTAAGVYTVRLVVRDKDGGWDDAVAKHYVVVYNPGGGFVTGGGWIMAPPGSLAPAPGLAGKATYGFVAKYLKGAPTGQTEFQFHPAKLNFHSTSYDWLVVVGAEAIYRGQGRLNGLDGYRFLVSLVDGKYAADGVDRFRMRIWDKASGAVIFDSQQGDPEYAGATLAADGGNLVIHPK